MLLPKAKIGTSLIYNIIVITFWTRASNEATLQAIDIASAANSDISHMLPKPAADNELATLPNIVGQFLNLPVEKKPTLPKSNIGVQKAALMTFQTWSARNHPFFGILFGTCAKKKSTGIRLIVGKTLDAVWSNENVKGLQVSEEIHPLAIVMPDETGWESVRHDWCSKIMEVNPLKEALFIKVAVSIFESKRHSIVL